MPIYAYRCGACGHSQDVLQKLSDPLLTTCPACGAEAFSKQVTAAGFQLKGSGWYVTDFRDGGGKKKGDDKPAGAAASEVKTDSADTKPADAKPADAKPGSKPAEAKSDSAPSPAAAAPAATPPPAPSGGSSS